MIVRELVTRLSFAVNTASLLAAEKRVGMSAARIGKLGLGLTTFVTLPMTLFGKSMIEAANEVEVLEKSLVAFLGTAEKAKAFKGSIFDFARESPLLTVQEIGKQSTRLLGIGFDPEKVIPTLRTLGTIASVTQRPLQRLVKAYVDVRQTGKLQGQEIRQFAQNSVGILNLLSKSMGRPIKEIDALQKAGKISFAQVHEALEYFGGKGSKNFAVIAAIAKTTTGRLLKLSDTFYLFRAELGRKLLPVINKLITGAEIIISRLRMAHNDTKRFILVLGLVTAALGPLALLVSFIGAGAFLVFAKFLIFATLLALVIEDIYVGLTGGHSITGKIIKRLEPFLKWLKPELIWLKDTLLFIGKESWVGLKGLKPFAEDILSIVKGIATYFHQLGQDIADLENRFKNSGFYKANDKGKRSPLRDMLLGPIISGILPEFNFPGMTAAMDGYSSYVQKHAKDKTPPKYEFVMNYPKFNSEEDASKVKSDLMSAVGDMISNEVNNVVMDYPTK